MIKLQNYSVNVRKYLGFSLVCLLFFLCQIALQFLRGAFSNEFGGYPDEAGHYITGLMVRDYIAGMQYLSPMEFAEDFYIHYPKVSLGHWPPFFYIMQGVWTLLFSASRTSMMLLMGLLTALLSSTVYLVIKKDFGPRIGIGAGIFLITLPLVQTWSGMLMAEILVALLSLWSVLCFGRFLDTGKWQWSIGFGILATLTILTKGNGLLLVLVVPLALLFNRRICLVKKLSFWYPLIIVIVFCGPWCWLTKDMVRNGMMGGAPSLGFTKEAFPYYSYELVHIVGIGLFFIVMVGLIVKWIKPYLHKRVEGKWAALGALLIGVWLFHCIVPAGLEARHLITGIPALVMFLLVGLRSISKIMPFSRFTDSKKEIILYAVVVAVFLVGTFSIPKKTFYGFGNVAQQLVSNDAFKRSVILVSSDEVGEGAFISEVAMGEQRSGHIVLRASKFLSSSRWDGANYKLLYSTLDEMMNCLKKIPVGIVVLDTSISGKRQGEHHHMLKETLERYPKQWTFFGSYPITRGETEYSDSLLVYVQKGHENRSANEILIDMSDMLGRSIKKGF